MDEKRELDLYRDGQFTGDTAAVAGSARYLEDALEGSWGQWCQSLVVQGYGLVLEAAEQCRPEGAASGAGPSAVVAGQLTVVFALSEVRLWYLSSVRDELEQQQCSSWTGSRLCQYG